MSIYYIQIVDNRREISPLRKKCMASLKDKIRSQDTYEVIQVEYNENPQKLIQIVDRVKLLKAAEIPNLCVVDTDCFISRPLPDLKLCPDMPYFAPYNFNDQDSIPDIFYFFVNGRSDYFAKYLNPDKISNPGGYSVDIGALRKLKGFHLIRDDSFLHTYEIMSEVVHQQKLYDLKKEFESDKMELTMLRNNIEQMAMVMKTYENLRKAYNHG